MKKEYEPGSFWHFLNNLKRSPKDGMIAGICSGLARSTPAPVWFWRAVFLASIFVVGITPLVYAILWIVMPVIEETETAEPVEPAE